MKSNLFGKKTLAFLIIFPIFSILFPSNTYMADKNWLGFWSKTPESNASIPTSIQPPIQEPEPLGELPIIPESITFEPEPLEEAPLGVSGLTVQMQNKIDSIIEATQGDALRYFFSELITKSTSFSCSFKENQYLYTLDIYAKFQKNLPEILLGSLGNTPPVSYDNGRILLGGLSFEIKQWYQERITIELRKNASYDAEQMTLLKDYFTNAIFPYLQESQEKLTSEYLYSTLEIQENEKLLFVPGKIDLIFPLEGGYSFDFNTDLFPLVSELGSADRDYMFGFFGYIETLRVQKNGNEIQVTFIQKNQTLKIEIQASGVSTLSKDLIQNFVKNLLKHLRSLNTKKEISQIKGLMDMGVQVYMPEENISQNIDEYFSKYGFVGYEDVKQTIAGEVIKPWKNKDQYLQRAAEYFPNIKDIIPNTVLFEGVPGTGKTTYAKVIGEYLGYPFVYIPIGKLMSKWYGESETRLSMILEMCGKLAEETSGVVIMIDEIDEIGGNRDKSHEATARITGVLLKKLDGLEKLENILMVCSTNRKESLDSALLSRFKLQQNFRLPNDSEIQAILKHYIGIDEITELQVARFSQYSGRQLKGVGERFAKFCIEKSVDEGKKIDKNPAWEEFCRTLDR